MTRGGGSYLSFLRLLKNFYFSLRRAQAARGPLLSAPAESRQRQAQGSFTPLRIPGPKWGARRPPLETPKSSLARQTWPNSSPLARLELRCRWGRPRARARSPRLPHLHRFGVGASPPCPQGSPLGDVCRSCAHAHGTASETAFAATPPQISRKLLPRKRLGVPSLPSRELRPKAAPARPQRGNPKGGAALFGQSLPTFCWPESRGPARPERVEGIN